MGLRRAYDYELCSPYRGGSVVVVVCRGHARTTKLLRNSYFVVLCTKGKLLLPHVALRQPPLAYGIPRIVGHARSRRLRLRVVRTREAIPLPQRLRLLCAAKRIERVGSDRALSLVQGWFRPEAASW